MRKAAVLGPGAVGGALAVHLADAGVHVVCVPRRDMVSVLALSGLALEVAGGEPLLARPEVRDELVQPVDFLFVTVKAHQLESALEQVDPGAVEDAVVLPLLNGLEHVDVLRAALGPRVVVCSLGQFEAYRVGRVQIIQTTPSGVIALASDEVPGERLEDVATMLGAAGFEGQLERSEKQVLWSKAARAAVLSAATALTHSSVGQLLSDPAWRSRIDAALVEACGIAEADGAAIDPSTQWAIIDAMDYDLTTSTARDVAEGRPSELDAISGSVVRAGARLGVSCPVLSVLYTEAAVHAADIVGLRR